ncbi:MAG: NPXTG-anchored protein [Oscillospiraceae bacterium]|jgi:LPXTG-motif cell wall-anchored protein|nr:NPXTG-anchored protein [Oscillospiraceae bacterium]
MKLAKKMLACVVALVLMASFSVMAFAEAKTVEFVVAAQGEAVVGKTVVISLSAKNAVGLASADILIGFDPAVLEFDAAATNTLNEDWGIKDPKSKLNVEGGLVQDKDDQVSASLTSSKAITTAETSIANYVFKVKAAGDAKLTATVESITGASADGNTALEMVGKTSVSSLTAKTAAATTTTTTTKAPSTTGKTNEIPKTGEAGLAVAAGLVVLAGAAFVVSKKKK